MAGYERLGYLLGFLGGILMILVPILDFIGVGSLHIPGENYLGLISGNQLLVMGATILIAIIILGIIGVGPLRVSKDPNEILVGILLIVLGFVGGTVGGLLAIVGGIFYIVDEATS